MCSGKQGVSMGLWSHLQGGGTKQGLQWAQGLPCRGPRRATCRCAACGMHCNVDWPAQPCLTANTRQPWARGCSYAWPPWGHRGAARRTSNSWRINNLICWSAGGEPSWGASLAVPAWPCPLGQPAASGDRGSSSKAEVWGCPSGRGPCPQHWSCGPSRPSWGRQLPYLPAALEGRGQQGGRQGRL